MMKKINTNDLGFSYKETDFIVRCSCHENKWNEPYLTSDKHISLHVCATSLQYGQSVFEGMKVFNGVDGKIRIFRWHDYALRMQSSALATYMTSVPETIFEQGLHMIINANKSYIPTCNTTSSLYIRPLLIGTTPQLGVGPGKDFEFILMASPIGSYYHSSSYKTFVISRLVDRVAPLGLGAYKVAGNYVNSFRATVPAHQDGYDCIFLDAKNKQFIDECAAANFIGIKNNEYLTPKSPSILPSITNNSLMKLASDAGIPVKQKKIKVEELKFFTEAAACGTASVVVPMNKILDPLKKTSYSFPKLKNSILLNLAKKMQNIQYGISEDTHNWCTIIE